MHIAVDSTYPVCVSDVYYIPGDSLEVRRVAYLFLEPRGDTIENPQQTPRLFRGGGGGGEDDLQRFPFSISRPLRVSCIYKWRCSICRGCIIIKPFAIVVVVVQGNPIQFV